MLELYHFHGATCGLKARLALAEKGVEFVSRALTRADLRKPAYLKLNRNGVVPTLVHDGEVLNESSVIINYIDDAFEGPPLKPASAIGIARTWWWMKRADDCLASIGVLTYTISMRPKILEMTPDDIEQYIVGIPQAGVRERRRRIIEMGFSSPDFPTALQSLDTMLADMEQALADKDWLAAPDYGLADTAMTPLVERLDELQCADMWRQRRHRLSGWWERVRSRASYAACLGPTPNPEQPQHQKYGAIAWPEIKKMVP